MHLDRVDVLIVAPHPDDEVIGCGGVIQKALAAGKKVRVAFATSGDGYPKAAAALLAKPEADLTGADLARLGATREREAIAAAAILGLGESHLLFLRHPDGALERVERQAAEGFEEVVLESRASEIYVSSAADEHADHRATHRLVAHAARNGDPATALFTYMVHGAGETWPSAGRRFERGALDRAIPWPPPVRITLTRTQVATKLRALKAHASQWVLDHDYLGRFAKEEEVFWT